MEKNVLIRILRRLCLCVILASVINVQARAGEIEVLKEGHDYYWNNIRDGKGSCTVHDIFFDSENQNTPQFETVANFNWMFLGSKLRYDVDKYQVKNGKPTLNFSYRMRTKVYFDGEKTLACNELALDPEAKQGKEKFLVKVDNKEKEMFISERAGKNFILRDIQPIDFQFISDWDPRLIATKTIIRDKSWQHRPSWEEENRKIVGREKIGNSDCYVIESVITVPKRFQIVNRRWIDPNLSYCVVKSVNWSRFPEDAVISKEEEWLKPLGDLMTDLSQVEFVKYGNTFYGPAKYTEISYNVDPQKKIVYIDHKREIIYDKNCVYNIGLSEKDLELTLPSDANIYDAYADIAYPTNPLVESK